MNEKDLNLDIDIDRLKKDPSLNEVLNLTQAIFNKLPQETNDEKPINSKPAETTTINQDSIQSLLTTAQSIINPATLSLLSNSLKQQSNKSENSRQAVDELTSSMNALKEELKQVKTELAERNQRLTALESEVKSLKYRKRR
jgi:peptidoglycan hydrolase CwlO-like protein